MKKYLVALGFVAASCSPVTAQMMCGGLVGFLEAMHNEGFEQQGRGDLPDNRQLQIWATDAGEYLIAIIEGNTACIAAGGLNYVDSLAGGDL